MSGHAAIGRDNALAGLLLALLWPATAAVAGNFLQPFDVGVRYGRELHVDASARAGGDGSRAAPFRTIAEALARATPGTRVRVAAGSYGAVGSISRLQGTAQAPIALVGDGEVFIETNGQGAALHLADPRYVVIEGLAIRNAVPHGINIDDGGSYDSPADHVVLRNVTFSRIGNGGNNDCLKMSGVDHFYIEGSRFTGCNQGEAIDMVGCHHGDIAGNVFADMPGSADVLIHGNRFTGIGQQAINAGGHTGRPYFRPLDSGHEAERIRMVANVIERGAGAGGFFINNVIVFAASRLRGHVDVGSGSRPATFTFGWNLWYVVDDESFAGPEYTGGLPAEKGAIVGKNPLLDADRRPLAGSPALTPGRGVPRGPVADFERREFGQPPNRGAFAGP